ncbi:MAG: hypothetical protein RL686_1735, partial [Pseudomonadota bacterium]
HLRHRRQPLLKTLGHNAAWHLALIVRMKTLPERWQI